MWKTMTVSQWLILFLLLVKDVCGLKNVLLTIEPSTVQRLQTATLRCTYDLEEAKLYYVKWYRGTYEFFRYTPSEQSTMKIFPYGLIKVDMNRSNSTQVVLLEIDFQLAGPFSCEVTTAEDPVSTGTDTKYMKVVQLPEHSPTISVGREPLDYGDTLRANCTSSPSRPRAHLKFYLNNLLVVQSAPMPESYQSVQQEWSDLSLELVLGEFHFSNGRLILRCVSEVSGIYHEEAELKLDSARGPVSEKVSADDSTLLASSPSLVTLFILLLLIES